MTSREPDALRVGVAGCGALALQVHLPLLAGIRAARVTAVAEADPARRAAALRLVPGAAGVADPIELAARSDVDAVVVCLPPALHAAAAEAALRAGRHVYVEKPIATELEDAARVIAAWRGGGAVGMVGFNYRFNRLVGAARRALREGRIGRPIGVRSIFATAGGVLPEWKRRRRTGGGALLDLGSHHFDLLPHLLDAPVREVFAVTRSAASEADCAWVHLRLGPDLEAQAFFSLAAVEEDRVEVLGEAGAVAVDRYGALALDVRGPGADGALRKLARRAPSPVSAAHLLRKLRSPWHEPSFEAALRAFVVAARDGRQAAPDLEDGWRALAAVAAAERSAASGRLETVAPLPARRAA